MLKILVVDDSKMARKRVIENIKQLDVEITIDEAVDGIMALDMYQKNDYNLVLTDIEMPNMNGLELIKALRDISEGLDIVVITAVASEQIKQLLKAERYTSYIKKPIDSKVLETLLLKTHNHILKMEEKR